MTPQAFRDRAKALGYSDEWIQEALDDRDEAKAKGIDIPLELSLTELPVDR